MLALVKRGDKGGSWDIAEEEYLQGFELCRDQWKVFLKGLYRAPTPEDTRIRPESSISVIRVLGLN